MKRFNDVFKIPFVYKISDVSSTWTEFQKNIGQIEDKNIAEEFDKRMLTEHPSSSAKLYCFDVYPNGDIHYANEVNFVIVSFTFTKSYNKVLYFIKLSLCFKVQPGAHVSFNTVSHGHKILEEGSRNLIIKWIEDNTNKSSRFSLFINSLIETYILGKNL